MPLKVENYVPVISNARGYYSDYPIYDNGGQVFNALNFGVKADGSTDNTAAINRAITVAQAAGGGTIYFPAGVYRVNGAIYPGYTLTGNNPKQKPIRLTGVGSAFDGTWITNPINGGSVLDLRYAGTDGLNIAKIDTRGAGFLEIDHLTLKSGGTDNFPILRTTNTTLFVHHNAFIGNIANSGTNCQQDAILLGGTGNGEGTDDIQAGFQGYGTKLQDNYYGHIRSVVFQTYANAIEVQNETFSTSCGSNLAQGAPFRFQPMAGFGASGVKIIGGTVEMGGYPYVVALMNDSQANTFDNIGAYDDGATTLGYIYAGASNCSYNYVQVGLFNQSKPSVAGNAGTIATWTIIDPRNQNSYMPGGVTMPTITFANGLGSTRQATISSGGRIWSAVTPDTTSGGPMSINTGPGGSYFDLTAFSQRFYDQAGVLMAEIMAGKGAGAIRVGAGATGNRPPAATVGAGSLWYDTTVGKLIVSTGSAWQVVTST